MREHFLQDRFPVRPAGGRVGVDRRHVQRCDDAHFIHLLENAEQLRAIVFIHAFH